MSEGKAEAVLLPFELGPEPTTVWTVSFLIELPGNLRVPETKLILGDDAEPWPGWPEESVALLVGEMEIPDHHQPVTVLHFRSATSRGPVILQAADRAFPDWDAVVNGTWARRRRHLRLWWHGLRGIRERHTVVKISRFIWRAEDLSDFDQTYEWISRIFDECLAALNEYIVALAAGTDEVQHSALARIDLPHAIPVLVAADPPPQGWADVLSTFDAHATLPIDGEGDRSRGEITQVSEMINRFRSGTFPFFQWIELYQAAEHHLAAGRYMQSVISATTGVEVLVNTIIRASWGLRERDPDKLAGVLDCGFRSLVKQHLAELLGEKIDLDDPETPAGRWYEACYQLRNRVVHEGHKPTSREAYEAKIATGKFARSFSDPLLADMRTRGLGEYLRANPDGA